METYLLRTIRVLVGVLLGLLVAFWILQQREPMGPESVSAGEDNFLSTPMEAPTFLLTSHLGEPTSSEDFPEKFLVVFFGYTYCPDVCPLTLSKLTEAFRLLGPRAEALQVLLVSVDPDRDSPDQLRRYLANFHSSFLGLTGSAESIRDTAEGFGAHFEANGTGQDYTVDHTARVFVVTPEGRIPLTFTLDATPVEMARDLETLLATFQEGAS